MKEEPEKRQEGLGVTPVGLVVGTMILVPLMAYFVSKVVWWVIRWIGALSE